MKQWTNVSCKMLIQNNNTDFRCKYEVINLVTWLFKESVKNDISGPLIDAEFSLNDDYWESPSLA